MNTPASNPSSPDSAPIVCGVDVATTPDSSIPSATGAAEVVAPAREIKSVELPQAAIDKLNAIFGDDGVTKEDIVSEAAAKAAADAAAEAAKPKPRILIQPRTVFDITGRQVQCNEIILGAEHTPADFA